MRTRVVAALLALVLPAGLGVGIAAAATLEVTTASGIAIDQVQRCAAAMEDSVPVVRTSDAPGAAVAVSNVPAACEGLRLSVNVHNAEGAIIATGYAAVAAASQDVVVGPYAVADVAAVVATIDGWIFPTWWTAASVDSGAYCEGVDEQGNVTGDPCTLTFTSVVNTWESGGYYYTQFQFLPVTDAFSWRVTFDFSDTTHFQGFTPVRVGHYYGVALAEDEDCSKLPILRVESANPTWPDRHGDIIMTNDPHHGVAGQLCPAP